MKKWWTYRRSSAFSRFRSNPPGLNSKGRTGPIWALRCDEWSILQYRRVIHIIYESFLVLRPTYWSEPLVRHLSWIWTASQDSRGLHRACPRGQGRHIVTMHPFFDNGLSWSLHWFPKPQLQWSRMITFQNSFSTGHFDPISKSPLPMIIFPKSYFSDDHVGRCNRTIGQSGWVLWRERQRHIPGSLSRTHTECIPKTLCQCWGSL